MQDIENDMDDLFRRAGENYPLKKRKGDWESVLKKMPVPGDQELTLKKQAKKDSRKIFIFFLLAVILILSALLIYNLDPKLKPLGKLATSKEVKKNIEDKDLKKNSQAENKPASKGVVIRNESTEIHSERNKKTLQLISFSSDNICIIIS